MKGEFNLEAGQWPSASAVSKDLVSSMLTLDVNKRITLTAIMNHPWTKSGLDQLHNCQNLGTYIGLWLGLGLGLGLGQLCDYQNLYMNDTRLFGLPNLEPKPCPIPNPNPDIHLFGWNLILS